jgi:hypothetical protein
VITAQNDTAILSQDGTKGEKAQQKELKKKKKILQEKQKQGKIVEALRSDSIKHLGERECALVAHDAKVRGQQNTRNKKIIKRVRKKIMREKKSEKKKEMKRIRK